MPKKDVSDFENLPTPKPAEVAQWRARNELAELRNELADAQKKIEELQKKNAELRKVLRQAVADDCHFSFATTPCKCASWHDRARALLKEKP
jgi:predicted RNase H-like nuclease (RuvC/YqgF family)